MSERPQSWQSATFRYTPQDIDLLALITTLWQGRRVVAGITVLFTLCGLVTALLLPRTWTSTAEVVVPEATQLAALNPQLTRMQALGITPDVNAQWLFSRGLRTFSAPDNVDNWLAQSEPVRERLTGKNEQARLALADRLKAGFTLTDSRTEKKNPAPYEFVTLTARADSPVFAQQLLQGYLEYVQKKTDTMAQEVLFVQVQEHLMLARASLSASQQQARASLDVQIARLSLAQQLAVAAGIQQPLFSRDEVAGDDPDFPVRLGVKGLTKKLAIFRDITDLQSLNADLSHQQLLADNLAALPPPVVTVAPWVVLQRPDLPLKPDGVTTPLIVVLGTLLGFMAGSGGLLFREALRAGRSLPRAAPGAQDLPGQRARTSG